LICQAKVSFKPSKDAVNMRLYEGDENRCGVCYLPFWKKETPDTLHDKVVAWDSHNFHVTCANYWLNRVSQSAPLN